MSDLFNFLVICWSFRERGVRHILKKLTRKEVGGGGVGQMLTLDDLFVNSPYWQCKKVAWQLVGFFKCAVKCTLFNIN